MTVDLKERITGLVAQGESLRLAAGPPGWGEKYIIHLGEIPWWEIDDPKEKKKIYNRQQVRMWNKLHPGVSTRAQKLYREKHPGMANEAVRQYREDHPGVGAKIAKQFRERHPEAAAEAMRQFKEKHPRALIEMRVRALKRFRGTPKGRASMAKGVAIRRDRSTNPEAYAARVEMLHVMHEPCAKCRAPYKTSHQIDHIIALCLGGTDKWDNYQSLCVECHKKKTGQDMQMLKRCAL